MKKNYMMTGMQFRDAVGTVEKMTHGLPVRLVREPTNRFDVNAIQVWYDGKHVAYVPKNQNAALAAWMDQQVLDGKLALDSAEGPGIDATFIRSPNSGNPMIEVDFGEGSPIPGSAS